MSAAADDLHVFRSGSAKTFIDDDDFKAHVTDQLGEIREAMSAIPTADQIRHAVAAGMRDVLRDPEAWEDASEGMSRAAQRQAGKWLFGGVKAAVSRVLWLVVVGLIVYQLGGWTALVSLFKAGSSS